MKTESKRVGLGMTGGLPGMRRAFSAYLVLYPGLPGVETPGFYEACRWHAHVLLLVVLPGSRTLQLSRFTLRRVRPAHNPVP
jgi:hypothetical protein